MVRLVYQTELFGALYLEYTKPLVRVGSSQDNDLVLPHSSVLPYHCSLLLEEEAVVVLPANWDLSAEGSLPESGAPRYLEGDTLLIGEVPLLVEHSPNTVAVPRPMRDDPTKALKTPEGYWRADAEEVPDTARWLCRRCGIRLEDSQVRVIGLQHGRKHLLCPRSHELELLVARPAPPKGFLGVLRSIPPTVCRWFGIRPRRG